MYTHLCPEFLRICTKEMGTYTKIPLSGWHQLNKLQHIHTTEYYAVIKNGFKN